jgi:hypothetical protein
MVDFKKLLEERVAAMTPEERARYDARCAADEAADATKRSISATFKWTPAGRFYRTGSADPEPLPSKTEVRDIAMRIEQRGDREVLQFIGGVTGYESYHLDERFAKVVVEWMDRPTDEFFICAGTPGAYASCSVSTKAIFDYVCEIRPHLFSEEMRNKASAGFNAAP